MGWVLPQIPEKEKTMAISRSANLLSQQRLDCSHLRAIESAVNADFDTLAGAVIAGNQGLVVQGLELVGSVGAAATTFTLTVAGAKILHPLATEAGTCFAIADDTAAEVLDAAVNANVIGSFTAAAINYVGLDLRREADALTTDTVMFLNETSLQETPMSVPLAKTLSYRITISTLDFDSTENVLPLAKITVDSNGTVTVIQDARQLLFRLGSGGSIPDSLHAYPWAQGRTETAGTFTGGDKAITSVKAGLDAMMTRIWEVGGGEHWYSATTYRDVKLALGPFAVITDNFEWNLGAQTLKWSGLSVVFANSTGVYNDIASNTGAGVVLLADQCLYVDVDRTQNLSGANALVPAVASLATVGAPTIPGSRFILAWRRGNYIYTLDRPYEVGRAQILATVPAYGVVKLTAASATPTVVPVDANGIVDYQNVTTAGADAMRMIGAAGNGGTPAGGDGVSGVGGAGNGAGTGGDGVRATGGAAPGAGGGGYGVYAQGGASVGGAGGIAVYGLGGAPSGPGVQGLGGAPNGDGVLGTCDGTGAGVHADGAGTGLAVKAENGNVECESTFDYVYSAARTKHILSTSNEWIIDASATGILTVNGSGGIGAFICLQSQLGAVGGQFKLPAGAIVTSFEVRLSLSDTGAAAKVFEIYLDKITTNLAGSVTVKHLLDEGGADNATWTATANPGPVAGWVGTTLPGPAGGAWSGALTAGVSIADEDCLIWSVKMPDMGAAGGTEAGTLLAVRLTYTMTTVAATV